jgi:hypothetical protein
MSSPIDPIQQVHVQGVEQVPNDTLFNTKEAAQYICMSMHWLKATRFRPELMGPPFIGLSERAIRYSKEDLDMWLKERRYRGTWEYPAKKGGVI